MSDLQPTVDYGKWQVCTEVRSDCIFVGPGMGWLGRERGNHYVKPPNRLERLLGITFESKIERAVQKCQKYCDRENARVKIFREKARARWQKEASR